MAGSAEIKIEGIEALTRNLTPDLYREPVKAGLKVLGQMGKAHARSVAPVASGRLQKSIGFRVKTKSKEAMGVSIRVGAKAADGYPYPKRIEYDPRSRHKGWLEASVTQTAKAAPAVLADVASAIEENWAKR